MTSKAGKPLIPPSKTKLVYYALSGIVAVMVIGTVGFHEIEGMGWVNSVYFESMLATGQGPPLQLNTDAGKIFASVMAFVSVGAVLTTLFVTLGPILSQAWREGLEKAERDARSVERELEGKKEDPDK